MISWSFFLSCTKYHYKSKAYFYANSTEISYYLTYESCSRSEREEYNIQYKNVRIENTIILCSQHFIYREKFLSSYCFSYCWSFIKKEMKNVFDCESRVEIWKHMVGIQHSLIHMEKVYLMPAKRPDKYLNIRCSNMVLCYIFIIWFLQKYIFYLNYYVKRKQIIMFYELCFFFIFF